MERLALAVGGYAVNSVEDLDPQCLGFAASVYEHSMGDDKYTFIETASEIAKSCTILIRGPNNHTVTQIKEAVRDGLRAVRNCFVDGSVVPGAGAFEVAAYLNLLRFKETVKGRVQLGVQAFADALLVIPKTLAANSGLDVQDALLELIDEAKSAAGGGPKEAVGLDLTTGKPLCAFEALIFDNLSVKKQFLHLGSIIATKLLLVDEVMRAGRPQGKDRHGEDAEGPED